MAECRDQGRQKDVFVSATVAAHTIINFPNDPQVSQLAYTEYPMIRKG